MGEDALDFAGSLGFGGQPDFGVPDVTQFNPGSLNFQGSDFSPGVGYAPSAWDRVSSGARGFAGGVADAAGKVGTGIGKEFTDRPLDALTKSVGLGVTGFGLANQFKLADQANQQTKLLQRSQQSAQAAAAPAVTAGTSNIQNAQAGKLPAPMEAAVAQWLQEATADINARFASMGEGNSTDITSEIDKAKLAAEAMRANLLQSQESLGTSELQTGVSAATGVAQSAQNQQQTLTQMIAAANQMLGLMGGRTQ